MNLVEHLERLARHSDGWWAGTSQQAASIRANPHAHIDALVEAGVLRRHQYSDAVCRYSVVKPHTHTWQVSSRSSELLPEEVLLWCTNHSCKETRRVPNKLPLEVPR